MAARRRALGEHRPSGGRQTLPGGRTRLDAGAADRGGRPLPAEVRHQMGGALGHDFGQVRICTDDAPWGAPESLGASAYTVGHDIALARGAYAPDTTPGRFLLAHELAHVVQQSGAAAETQPDGPRLGEPVSIAELDATAAALDVAGGQPAGVHATTPEQARVPEVPRKPVRR